MGDGNIFWFLFRPTGVSYCSPQSPSISSSEVQRFLLVQYRREFDLSCKIKKYLYYE